MSALSEVFHELSVCYIFVERKRGDVEGFPFSARPDSH